MTENALPELHTYDARLLQQSPPVYSTLCVSLTADTFQQHLCESNGESLYLTERGFSFHFISLIANDMDELGSGYLQFEK